MTTNDFASMSPIFKESYAKDNRKSLKRKARTAALKAIRSRGRAGELPKSLNPKKIP